MEQESAFDAYTQGVIEELFLKRDIEIPNSIAHAPNPEKMLKQAIKGAIRFITHPAVQQVIAEDFDAAHYRRFDPSCGDDGCQSRPLILQQIRRIYPSTAYAALPDNEKLYLSLCHALAYHFSDVIDMFDALLQERQGTHIMCDSYVTNARNKPVLHHGNEAAWVLSYVVATLSVTRLKSIRDQYAIKTPELNALFRLQFSHRGLPQLSTQESEQLAFWDSIAAQQPFLHCVKILRKNAEDQYYLEGHLHMMYVPQSAAAHSMEDIIDHSFRLATDAESVRYANEPMLTILSQALLTEERLPGNHIFAMLSEARSLEQYHETLSSIAFPSLLGALSVKDDEDKERFAETMVLFPRAAMLRKDITFEGRYVENVAGKKGYPDFYRIGHPSPLFTTHWVLSTLAAEQQTAKMLEEKLAQCAAEQGLERYMETAHCQRKWHMGVEERM